MSDHPLAIDVEALDALRAEQRPLAVLDVREDWELDICRIDGSIDIPLGELPRRVEQLPTDRPIVVICHHGMRSMQATQWLRARGYGNAINLTGGVDAYARRVDPRMAVY